MVDIQNTNDESNNKQTQRIHAILFLVMLAALVLGFWQINNNIRLPFVWLEQISTDTGNNTNTNLVSTEQLSLMSKDTDKDGLSDYDEVYLYRTSPYLQDTDSDTYLDKQEIETLNDPTCPAHQTCLKSAPSFTKGDSSPQTVAELRESLKQAGLKEEDLKTIDDATLLQVYNEVALETGITGATTDSGTSNSNASITNIPDQGVTDQSDSGTETALTEEEKQFIKQMSGSELRTFLKQNGINSPELDKVDDSTLKLIVNQALGL